MGRKNTATPPIRMMTMDNTHAKIGRSMKNRANMPTPRRINPKSEIRNPKSEIRTPKSETNPNIEALNSKLHLAGFRHLDFGCGVCFGLRIWDFEFLLE